MSKRTDQAQWEADCERAMRVLWARMIAGKQVELSTTTVSAPGIFLTHVETIEALVQGILSEDEKHGVCKKCKGTGHVYTGAVWNVSGVKMQETTDCTCDNGWELPS